MSWILITIIAYFFLALVNLLDKFLLEKVLGSSKVYAFLISLMSGLVLFLAPWFLEWPGTFLFIFQLVVGCFFPIALILMFEALKRGDASRITILIGGTIPILTIIFSLFFLKESYTLNQTIGIFFLILGTFLLAIIKDRYSLKGFSKSALFFSLGAALFYALFFIGTKYAYSQQEFVSAFLWLRVGGILVALTLLINPKDRYLILDSLRNKKKRSKKKGAAFMVLGAQGLGALAFVLQNYAISFGSVAIINALQGVQYAFLLLFAWLLTLFYPKIIKEDISKKILWKKIGAIVLISLGLYWLAF